MSTETEDPGVPIEIDEVCRPVRGFLVDIPNTHLSDTRESE